MKPTLRQRLRYHFDNLMSHGTPAMIGMLFVLSLAVVLLAGAVIALAGFTQDGGAALPFPEAVWESLMRTLDSGTMGSDEGTGFRAVMLFVTLGGIFIVSALIGVLNNAIEGQIERLRKVLGDILVLVEELRQGTIERVLAKSDLELGIEALMRTTKGR